MRPEIDKILTVVQEASGVTRTQLMASTRSSRKIAWTRQIAIHICHTQFPEISWSELGRIFGRDRTTVRHAHRTVAEWRGQGEDLNENLEELERVCTTAVI